MWEWDELRVKDVVYLSRRSVDQRSSPAELKPYICADFTDIGAKDGAGDSSQHDSDRSMGVNDNGRQASTGIEGQASR